MRVFRITKPGTSLALVALLWPSTGAASDSGASPPKATVAYRAKKLHLGDGRVLADGVLVIEGSVIRSVGQGSAVPEGSTVIEHAGSLTPGLIALHSQDGAGAELRDGTRTVMPEAESGFAFDPGHGDFARCVSAGITTIVLAPVGGGLAPGTTTVVKTSGGRTVKQKAQLLLDFSSGALSWNAFPTSYGGALAELERLFETPTGLVARTANGELPVLFEVDSREEIVRALDFAERHRLKGALNGSIWAEELVEAIQRSHLAVVCDPADPGFGDRGLRSILSLAAAGVRIGFGLDSPSRNPDALRFSAALAVRRGLEPERALQALTGDAALIAGVADRVGLLEQGREADFVLWSGDPLDLRSSVQAVYVDGSRVDGGAR